MRKVIYKTLALSLILSRYSLGQQGDLWTTFTAADGLADNHISAILESRDGALWFGTEFSGVSRYEAGVWTTFTSDDGLADNGIWTILESRDGAMWFGTTEGVSRYQDGGWKTFTIADGLADNGIWAILESRDGAMWFGTTEGVSRYQDGGWKTFTIANGLAGNGISTILESRDGAMWFGTTEGVSRYQDGVWKTFNMADGLVDNWVDAILESRDGTMWFGTRKGASRYWNGMWTTFDTADGLVSNGVGTIKEASDGALWFGTSEGVSRYQNDIWRTFIFTTDWPSGNCIRAIEQSRDDALWFGTCYYGVHRYQEPVWTTFTKADGLAANGVYAIEESRDGALWFGTSQGVSRYQNGVWKTFTIADGLAADQVFAIEESRDGALWFGTWGGGVSRYQHGIWKTFTTADGLTDNQVFAIEESSDGALWFGTIAMFGDGVGGVSRFQNGVWTNFNIGDGLAGNDVLAIKESRDGTLWFGTWGGVSRYQDGVWTIFTEADSLAGGVVAAIEQSRDGALWFGTLGGGASRYKDGSWTTFTRANGLADNFVAIIVESKDGALWFGFDPLFFLIYRATGGVSRYQDGVWTTFTPVDGLADKDVHAIVESSGGDLWFGTSGTSGGGVSRLKPDKSPPFTFILDGPKRIMGTPTPQFIFSGKDSRTAQDQLAYSYAVVESSITPQNSDWSTFSKFTAALTPALQNATYTFHIRARDAWGNIDPTPATRTFAIDITQPTVSFNSHKANDIVSDKVVLIGNALDTSPLQDFQRYELQYGFGKTQKDIKEWKKDRFSKIKTAQVFNDTLAIWNTEGLPNGTYWLQLSAYDTLKHDSHIFLNLEVVKSAATVDSRGGSSFVLDAGTIELYFPPNAFPKDTPLNVRDCPIQDLVPHNDPQLTFVNLCFELAPAELHLARPATLTLHYPDSLLIGKNEKKLALYRSTDGKSDWQRLGGSVDVEKNKITTTFKQLGVFALYEDLTAGKEAGIFQVASQPRIFSPQGGGFNTQTAISFELGKESNVTVKIYNTAGRLVRILEENEPRSYGIQVVYWNGKDEWNKYCVSGLYIVTIQAEDKTATKTVMVSNK